MNLQPRDCTQILLNQKKTELEIKRQHIIDGLLLCSQANWHENGEKCTEYFCKLEQKSFINKIISLKKSTVKPSDPGPFPFFINLSASPHSLNVKLPSQESLCSSVNLTSW
jgi:hypothetical protein